MARVSITKKGQELQLSTPYDAGFVAAFKTVIPQSARRWEKPVWLVSSKYEKQLVSVTEQFFGPVTVKVVAGTATDLQVNMSLRVEYIGACKAREDGTTSAYGFYDGGWNVAFPESVLRAYFHDGAANGANGKSAGVESKPTTLYACLGIEPAADRETIKAAYRRLARVWHPDVNREPDAPERFRRLKSAYDVLSGPQTRRRYDAGLSLEASVKVAHSQKAAYDELVYRTFYRAPFTCGDIEVRGARQLGRIIVESIEAWRDIVDKQGRTMVSSWPKGAESFQKSWIEPEIYTEVIVG